MTNEQLIELLCNYEKHEEVVLRITLKDNYDYLDDGYILVSLDGVRRARPSLPNTIVLEGKDEGKE